MSLSILAERKVVADAAYRIVKADYDRLIAEAKREAERKIYLFAQALYGNDLDELFHKAEAATKLVVEEQDRIALSGENAPIAIGTKLEKVSYKWSRHSKREKTLHGVFEVVSSQSEHSDTLSRYRRAEIGDNVVRILKADGTPSKLYEKVWVRADGTLSDDWKVA